MGEMFATFVALPNKTNDYREAVEAWLGKHYKLDRLGDVFRTSLTPIPVNPPW